MKRLGNQSEPSADTRMYKLLVVHRNRSISSNKDNAGQAKQGSKSRQYGEGRAKSRTRQDQDQELGDQSAGLESRRARAWNKAFFRF